MSSFCSSLRSYTTDFGKWQRDAPSLSNADWYVQGLRNQVAEAMKRGVDELGSIETMEKQDAKIMRFSGKGALHNNVLQHIAPGSGFQGAPFVNAVVADFGSVPVQIDVKWHSNGSSKHIAFTRQPWALQVVMNYAAYRFAAPEEDAKKGSRRHLFTSAGGQKECEYYYIFYSGCPHLLALDVDASSITRQQLYTAILAFRQAFRQALVRTLNFTEEQADATMQLMGTYESSTTAQRNQEQTATSGGADASRKRSVHIHCHFIGPVAKSFNHYQAWLYRSVLLDMPIQYRSLFDLKVYRNGAFRSLGCCKLPLKGAARKWLHPEPIPELSGGMLSALWNQGSDASRLWVLSTAHPAVVHEDVLPGGILMPETRYVPEAGSVMPQMNLLHKREAALHWNKIIWDNIHQALQVTHDQIVHDSQTTIEQKQALQGKLFEEYIRVAWTRRSDGTIGLATAAELHARFHRAKHSLNHFVVERCNFGAEELAKRTAEHFGNFYCGVYANDIRGGIAEEEADDNFTLDDLGPVAKVALELYGGKGKRKPGPDRPLNQQKRQRVVQQIDEATSQGIDTDVFTVSIDCDTQGTGMSDGINLLCSRSHFFICSRSDAHTGGTRHTFWLRKMCACEQQYLLENPSHYSEYTAKCSAVLPSTVASHIASHQTPALYAPELKWLRANCMVHMECEDIDESVRCALPGKLYDANGLLDYKNVRLAPL